MSQGDARKSNQSSPSLQRAGQTGAAASDWAMRLGAGALLVGAAVAAWSAFRPLPSPSVESHAPVIHVPNEFGLDVDLDQRERILADAADAGNIFAPDREAWSRDVAQATEENAPASVDEPQTPRIEDRATRMARLAAEANAGGPSAVTAFDSIPIDTSPPVEIRTDLRDLRLRGVYRSSRGPVALIGSVREKNKNSAEARRVGEVFGDEEWGVIAIDDVGKRVILSRSGVNVKLSMYELPEGAARVVSATGSAAPAQRPPNPPVVVMSRTPAQLRQELADAGLSAAEIDELMQLAEIENGAPVAATPTPQPTIGGAPETPPGLTELLKMMSTNESPTTSSRSNRRERRKDNDPNPPQ